MIPAGSVEWVTWTLRAVSPTQTELVLGPRIDVKPGIGTVMQLPMKMALKKLYPGLVDDLTTYIETGKPSARKQKEMEDSKQA